MSHPKQILPEPGEGPGLGDVTVNCESMHVCY